MIWPFHLKPKLEHAWGPWRAAKGHQFRVCTRCDATESVHSEFSFLSIKVPAGCYVPASPCPACGTLGTGSFCSKCGKPRKDHP